VVNTTPLQYNSARRRKNIIPWYQTTLCTQNLTRMWIHSSLTYMNAPCIYINTELMNQNVKSCKRQTTVVDRRNGLHSKGQFFSLWTRYRINSQPTQYVPCSEMLIKTSELNIFFVIIRLTFKSMQDKFRTISKYCSNYSLLMLK